jgi:hypothetical protein
MQPQALLIAQIQRYAPSVIAQNPHSEYILRKIAILKRVKNLVVKGAISSQEAMNLYRLLNINC